LKSGKSFAGHPVHHPSGFLIFHKTEHPPLHQITGFLFSSHPVDPVILSK
jgi:hypothetical protein